MRVKLFTIAIASTAVTAVNLNSEGDKELMALAKTLVGGATEDTSKPSPE